MAWPLVMPASHQAPTGPSPIAGDALLLAFNAANFDIGKLVTIDGIRIAGGADGANYRLAQTTATAAASINSAVNMMPQTPAAPTQTPFTPQGTPLDPTANQTQAPLPLPAASSSATPTMGSPTTAGVTVRTFQPPATGQTGLVTVSVPEQQATFVVPLPTEVIAQGATTSQAAVTATLENGTPLPSWIKLDASSMTLVAANVPESGLPIRVVFNIGGTATVIVITQSTKSTEK